MFTLWVGAKIYFLLESTMLEYGVCLGAFEWSLVFVFMIFVSMLLGTRLGPSPLGAGLGCGRGTFWFPSGSLVVPLFYFGVVLCGFLSSFLIGWVCWNFFLLCYWWILGCLLCVRPFVSFLSFRAHACVAIQK